MEHDKEVIIMKKDINFYGFPLKKFGLMIIGRKKPIDELCLRNIDHSKSIWAKLSP